MLSDLESILTCYCKVAPDIRKYDRHNGWIDLLLPLITLKLPRADTYNLFEAISDRYIPRHADAFHLLRLLILYHDPELCNFLDTKKVTPEDFAMPWVRLFCNFYLYRFLFPPFILLTIKSSVVVIFIYFPLCMDVCMRELKNIDSSINKDSLLITLF